ncbi:MAG: RHS repeat-associated core domain-containing protein [Pirellula sp.]|jgi:RHS repeat-associated protein
MNNHPNATPASPSLASPLFDASFDSIESLTTTFAASVVPTLETTTVTEVALGYHRNQQYSITAMTTSTGAVAERYAYTAYGQPTILDASGSQIGNQQSQIANRYTYTGREWDETLGLHHFRARWISPLAGRFLGRDPIGYVDANNLFQFVSAKPLLSSDPLGLYSLTDAEQSLRDQGVLPSFPGSFCAGSTFPLYVPPSYSYQQLFDEWIRLESQDLSWIDQLPRCPCNLTLKKRCIGWDNQGGVIISTERIRPVNPDASDWQDPGVPSAAEAALHPGAAYTMRSVGKNGNYNQCVFDADGKLITQPPGAGTVDRERPGTSGHYLEDVEPIVVANFLDGGILHGFCGVIIGNTQMLQPAGPNVQRYYGVRPSRHMNCP